MVCSLTGLRLLGRGQAVSISQAHFFICKTEVILYRVIVGHKGVDFVKCLTKCWPEANASQMVAGTTRMLMNSPNYHAAPPWSRGVL